MAHRPRIGPGRTAGDIAALVEQLRGGDAVRRDAAAARLRVIGSRAIAGVARLLADPAPDVRTAALGVLDGIEDVRVLDLALRELSSSDASVVIAAVGVLRPWITREPGTRVLDALAGIALDRAREAAVRLAALDALAELPRELVGPILEQSPERGSAMPDEAAALREWVAARGEHAPLPELHTAITRARERELAEPSGRRRQEWLAARGAAHAALARRGGRVALYDLREAFDGATAPLPLDFLAAMTALGDASCLEPMAHAWAAAPEETWWRERLEAAGASIVHRTRLSARSAVVKRIQTKFPGFVPSRTTAAPRRQR